MLGVKRQVVEMAINGIDNCDMGLVLTSTLTSAREKKQATLTQVNPIVNTLDASGASLNFRRVGTY